MPPPPDPHSGKPNDQDQVSSSIMVPEANEESIIALERQIEEGNGDIIKLKRARNSLLNISMGVPPEILGEIFSWILVRPDPDPDSESHFNRFPNGSYKFLLVCHHWFQVASHTPKLWTYCGNTLQGWEKWHHLHPQVTPLDLVLRHRSPPTTQPFIDPAVKDALRDRVTRDAVRQVHLLCHDGHLLSLVTSLLTPEGEGVQYRSIESIDLRIRWETSPDVPIFFSHIRLPKLRSLLLHGLLKLQSWDNLVQQTTLLTTLSLRIHATSPPPPPTTSQLFSILASNPNLEVLSLGGSAIPEDDDNISVSQVTLQHLKYLYLYGDLRHVVRVLEQLVFLHPLDSFSIATKDSAVESVLQALVLYVRFHLQGGLGVRDRLELTALTFRTVLLISAEGKHGAAEYTPFLAGFKVGVAQGTPRDVLENLCHDLVMSIPRLERVGDLHTNLPSRKLEDLLVAMPNIETLNLSSVKMSEGLLQPNQNGPCAKAKLLPSLKSLRLGTVALCNHDWGPPKAYLGHQTSDGQAISLKITGDIPHMCQEVATEIENLVGEFSRNFNHATRCPPGRCRGEAEESEGGGQSCTTAE